MRAVDFDSFSLQCSFLDSDSDVNGGYGCTHPEQQYKEEKNGRVYGCCFCCSCPLGIEAEQQDLTDREHPDAITDVIDWDGLCSDGTVSESEILLVVSDGTASVEVKKALQDYEEYLHRYERE